MFLDSILYLISLDCFLMHMNYTDVDHACIHCNVVVDIF